MSDDPFVKGSARVSGVVPRARRRNPAGLATLKDLIILPKIFGRPKQNSCVYLGPGSLIETHLQFSEFFDQDHTIAGWFMPQYPFGGPGPIFTSPGPQNYLIGQGDYRLGNGLYSALGLAPGIEADAGDPVLTVRAGSASRIYLAPSWKAGAWQHLAVVRTGNVLSLYVNGVKLQPVTVAVKKDASGLVTSKTVSATADLQLSGSLTGSDLGILQFGRSQHPTSTAFAQAYGLLDDVAVFDQALTGSQIANLVAKKRLTGIEPGLVAGWGFDVPAAGRLLPPKLAASWDEYNVGPPLDVSDDRDSSADRWLLDFPFVYLNNTQGVRFPFPKGEAWKVTQGFNDPLGSHNGDAAFCFDLVRSNGSSANAPIFASQGGFVFAYLRNGTVDKREPNRVVIYNGPKDHVVSYLHLKGNSLTDAVVDGDSLPADPDTWVTLFPFTERFVPSGEKLGLVGPLAAHLHLGAKEVIVNGLSVELSKNTIPMAFKEIQVLSPGDADWHNVLGFYIPKKGDQVRSTV